MEAKMERVDVDKNLPAYSEEVSSSGSTKSGVIKEGLAEVEVEQSTHVFYNPVQEFNRDISVAVLNLLAEDHYLKEKEKNETDRVTSAEESFQLVPGQRYENGIKILEALSATGLRGIRYAKEIAGVQEVIANDLSENAVKTIQKNILKNNVEDIVTATNSDASLLMYQHRRYTDRFHAIDLDPYGCPSVFLDGAVQSVKDGGILLVTCTDMAVLVGNSPETCYVKYGSVALRSKACHEMALRIVLQTIQAHANRYGRYIKPLLSISVDFYVRVVVQIMTGPSKCKYTTSNLASVYQCTGCETVTLQPLGIVKKNEKGNVKFSIPIAPIVGERCQLCNHRHHVGGPIWIGPLHSQEFLQRMVTWPGLAQLGTAKRLQGVLAVMLEELPDVPLYYTLDRLCSILHVETIPMLSFRSALLNAGYLVSYSHANRLSIKTNAPARIVWAIMKAWESDHPAKRDRFPADSPALAILNQPYPENFTANFLSHPEANPPSRRIGLSRFQENPTAFWGPGTRAQTRVAGGDTQAKSRRNQGKRNRAEISSSVEEQDIKKHLKPSDSD